ncbi:BrnA antitoxin family protein [Candidatus Methylopumilus turicensis]|uniref:Ribbon-helix-helix protein, copG family n=1 Tax=Candidatus Methylopumilus turicensis TaxID=1581680 RepID=A0A0B7J028_9PROT|nr:BrnA antitoxin family protein [Candidatus Methylopumilus turicensis]CEN56685.1 Ribbon-helix-helix protein, copG family [Candidatus Methylopumilus turicensis]
MKKEYNLTKAKRGSVVSARGKTRITIYLDDAVLAKFREQAESQGKGYQTLINEVLLQASTQNTTPVTEESLRKILREELRVA